VDGTSVIRGQWRASVLAILKPWILVTALVGFSVVG
jgi:hypothetical protein